jgi:hypothetical protein
LGNNSFLLRESYEMFSTLCRTGAQYFNVKAGGTYTYQAA